jgi:hypothetical protein
MGLSYRAYRERSCNNELICFLLERHIMDQHWCCFSYDCPPVLAGFCKAHWGRKKLLESLVTLT